MIRNQNINFTELIKKLGVHEQEILNLELSCHGISEMKRSFYTTERWVHMSLPLTILQTSAKLLQASLARAPV